MDLKNGYKVLYEVVDPENRVFKATKSVPAADDAVIATIAKGTYKLVYEKDGKVFGVPTAGGDEVDLTSTFAEVLVEGEVAEQVEAGNDQPTELPKEEPAAPVEPEEVEEEEEELEEPTEIEE